MQLKKESAHLSENRRAFSEYGRDVPCFDVTEVWIKMRESMRDRASRDLEHMDREVWAESYGKGGSQRLVICEDQGEGTAFTDASRASVLEAAEPLVGLAVLASRSLVLAIVDDTTTNEGDRVVKLVVPV